MTRYLTLFCYLISADEDWKYNGEEIRNIFEVLNDENEDDKDE